MDEAQKQKHTNYQELTEHYMRQSCDTRCEPIWVGCRGFAGRALCRDMIKLGIVGLAKKKDIKSINDAAQSHWVALATEGRSTAAGMQVRD